MPTVQQTGSAHKDEYALAIHSVRHYSYCICSSRHLQLFSGQERCDVYLRRLHFAHSSLSAASIQGPPVNEVWRPFEQIRYIVTKRHWGLWHETQRTLEPHALNRNRCVLVMPVHMHFH